MGCSSCGGASAMATPSLLASATPAQAGTWTVTYPNGNSRPFTTEWQAQAAQAVGGGEITYNPPAEPTARSTAAATSARTTAAKPTAAKPTAARATNTARKTAARKTTKRQTGRSGADVDEVVVDEPVVNDNSGGDGGGE